MRVRSNLTALRLAAAGFGGAGCVAQPLGPEVEPAEADVIILTATAGFRHTSIDAGVAAFGDFAAARGLELLHTEDPSVFAADLTGVGVVVFLSTTGDILDDAEQAGFEAYIQGGGGYLGVHSAADTEYGWPWYGQLVGAWFSDHPAVQEATVVVEDTAHPSTSGLGLLNWVRTDEWYNYQSNPRDDGLNVLLRLDETTYSGGSMPADHPIAWYHEFDGGRAFYTGGGHTSASYQEAFFRAHLDGALGWAGNF